MQSGLVTLGLLLVLISLSGVQCVALASYDPEHCIGVMCPKLVVRTDKFVYDLGETVTISGQIFDETIKAGEPVMIQILSPVEELIRTEIYPASDGTFSHVLLLEDLISIPSSYVITVTYLEHREAATFNFIPKGIEVSKCGFVGVCQYYVVFNNTNYLVDYNLNGIIQNITLNTESKSLLIDALVYSDASFLDLALNPELIRATEVNENGQERHLNFTILVNGKNAEKVSSTAPEFTNPTTDRRVFISKLEEGQNKVEIIGTRVIPEFGSLTLIIMAGTVAGLIVWTRSTVRQMDYRSKDRFTKS